MAVHSLNVSKRTVPIDTETVPFDVLQLGDGGETRGFVEFHVVFEGTDEIGRVNAFEVDVLEAVALEHDGENGEFFIIARGGI